MTIGFGAVALSVCADDHPTFSEASREEHEQVVETIGDTTLVRTLSGSVWGAEEYRRRPPMAHTRSAGERRAH